MHDIGQIATQVLGLGADPKDLAFYQICLRACVVFISTITMLRVGTKHFMSRRNPLDFVLAFLLASALSRAINGSAPFFRTIGLGFFLVFLHRMFTRACYGSHRFGRLVKGDCEKIVADGVADKEVMRRHGITKHDLDEDLYLTGAVEDIARVKVARLERNGTISILKKPSVHTVRIENGVQTIRIELEG